MSERSCKHDEALSCRRCCGLCKALVGEPKKLRRAAHNGAAESCLENSKGCWVPGEKPSANEVSAARGLQLMGRVFRECLLLGLMALSVSTAIAADSIWLKAGTPAPHSGVLLSPEKAAKVEAIISERDALLRESAARSRLQTATEALAQSWRDQLVISNERAEDFRGEWRRADRGYKFERGRGRVRWWQGVGAGIAAALLVEELR